MDAIICLTETVRAYVEEDEFVTAALLDTIESLSFNRSSIFN